MFGAILGAVAKPLIGAAAGSLLGGIGGKKAGTSQASTMSPEQERALKELLSVATPQIKDVFGRTGTGLMESDLFPQLSQALQPALTGFDPTRTQASFQANVADPAMQQFREEILPAIQERFEGVGGSRSSALNQAMVREGGQLQSRLSGQLAEMLRLGEVSGQEAQLRAVTEALGVAKAPGEEMRLDKESLLRALTLALGKEPFSIQKHEGQASPFAPLGGMLAKGAGSALTKALPSFFGG